MRMLEARERGAGTREVFTFPGGERFPRNAGDYCPWLDITPQPRGWPKSQERCRDKDDAAALRYQHCCGRSGNVGKRGVARRWRAERRTSQRRVASDEIGAARQI